MSTFTAHCNLTRTVDFRKVSCDETFNNRDDYLAHFHKLHGGPKSVKSRKRSLTWRMPARKAFEPVGVGVGSWVHGQGAWSHIRGQVWAKNGRSWWVADGTDYHLVPDGLLSLLAQAGEEAPLFTIA